MTAKILSNPWAMEMLALINRGMKAEDLDLAAGEKVVVIPALLNAGYLFRDEEDYYSVTKTGYQAIEVQALKNKNSTVVQRRDLTKLTDLVVKPHPRQADMDAMRAIPSLWNGVRYVAK
jgi:hypothetical protein